MVKIAFHEITFPPEIAYGATGGPEFSTDIVTSSSGFELRNINWIQARNRYNLAPSIKTKEQLEYLLWFFRLSQGKAIGFRFKDWADYQIKKQKIAIGDGKLQQFQLIKTYVYAEHEIVRKITKPISNTIKIYVNAQLVNPLIDSKTGMIIFEKPPLKGTIIQAEGEFDIAVRFDTDYLVASIDNYGVYSHQDIPLIEIKL